MERKSEIVVILNKYKNTFNNLIDSLDTESPDWLDFPDWPKLIDKESWNRFRSKVSLLTLLKENCLDKDVLVILLKPVPKIWTF